MKPMCVCAAIVFAIVAVIFIGLKVKGNFSAENGKTTLADGNALVKAGQEAALSEGALVDVNYDFSFTTFNVGGFAAGIDDGIHTTATNYGALDAIGDWKTVFDYDNDCANHVFKSDFYFFQECSKTLWIDNANKLDAPHTGETVMRNEVFEKIFKNVNDYSGVNTGTWGAAYSNMCMASNTFEVRDITYGTISGKYSEGRRAYMKGYIDVGDIEIAVYNVHLVENHDHGDVALDSYYELIELMNEDKYVIVGGDMNGSSVGEYMEKAGYKAANGGEFGQFQTNINHQYNFIDNIFVSPNIDIVHVTVGTEKTDRAYSDHLPLTAYLTVNEDASGVDTEKNFNVGEDGFTTEFR